MVQIKYLDRSNFEKTNYSYPPNISPKCAFSKYRGSDYGRITYYLPNKIRAHFYSVPKECASDAKIREKTILEFEMLIRNYLFPIGDVPKLREARVTSTNRKTSLDDAVDLYYTKFNTGKNKKKDKVIRNEMTTLKYLVNLFKANKHKYYLEDLVTKDLRELNDDLLQWCEENNKPIRESTGKTYKKMLKAFFNCCARRFDLNINVDVIDLALEDEELYSRTIYIPPDLLDAVDKLDYTPKSNAVNRQELIYFLRRTGLCKEELACLSEENLHPNKNNFDSIEIKNKSDCPTTNQIGFEVKTKRRERIIFLDQRCRNFLKNQMDFHKSHDIYGKVFGDDKEISYHPYRFLLPVQNHGRWLRCDDYLDGILSLIYETNEKFQLGYTDKYIQHDFRRTLNIEMGDSGMAKEDRAYILGHSEEVNEAHYMGHKKRQEAKLKKTMPVFKDYLQKKTSVVLEMNQ